MNEQTNNHYSFHQELEILLRSETEKDAREQLHSSLLSRGVAGCTFFSISKNETNKLLLNEIWSNDLSGSLGDFSPYDVLNHVISHIPKWLTNWISERKQPIVFSEVTKYIPFSGRLLLKKTSTKDANPITDFIFIPSFYKTNSFSI